MVQCSPTGLGFHAISRHASLAHEERVDNAARLTHGLASRASGRGGCINIFLIANEYFKKFPNLSGIKLTFKSQRWQHKLM